MLGYFLVIYLVLYFAAAFALPTYRVWKQTGISPVTFRGADTAHDYIGKVFKVVMAALAAVIFIYAFAPSLYHYFSPIVWLENRTIQFTGIALLLVSLGWTILAQVQMGDSWRIGIDEEKKTALVQTGLFRLSRNPIFLGMIIALIGVFLTLPNALTLLILALGFALIQIQARLEEEFLTRTRGAEYADFAGKVRRWL